MCIPLVRLLLHIVSVISIYTGIDSRYMRYLMKSMMRGTISATVVVFSIICIFTVSFVLCLLVCTDSWIR